MGKRWYELLAVFLAAMSTLLFEIVVTKIFEFSVWANYAYLVISTAMFGLGFSGVILMRWRRLLNARDGRFLFCTTVATGVAIWVAFFVINTVPINLPDAPRGWALELLAVGIDFFALSLPFTFFGLMISFLLHHRGREANVYYFADLIGAGVGAVILVPLIPIWWPQGIIFACGFASMAAACLFAAGVVRGPWRATALVGGGSCWWWAAWAHRSSLRACRCTSTWQSGSSRLTRHAGPSRPPRGAPCHASTLPTTSIIAKRFGSPVA